MSFTTISFLTFCLIFFAGYALLRGRARGCFLLLASCYFYGSWDVRFLALCGDVCKSALTRSLIWRS